MPTDIDDFGSTSNGLDRSQIHVGPQSDKHTDARPSPEALDYQKPSIRKAIKENIISVVVHPRFGVSKIKAAINEKHEATHSNSNDTHDIHAPTLAPAPAIGSAENQRLDKHYEDKRKLPALKEFIHQPIDSIVSTVQDQRGNDFAESIAKTEIAHGADVQLLNQEDKINNATTESDREAEYEIFVQMKQLRQDFFVRWSIDRHVRIVGRIKPPPTPPRRPPLFSKADPSIQQQTWSSYGQELVKYELQRHAQNYIDPEFEMKKPDSNLLSSGFERILVNSTSLQSLITRMRDISHWDNPRESAGYMCLYFFLLFYSYITRALILYVLCKALYRGWHPATLREMRSTLEHSENRDVTAHNLSELITQYGTRGWVDHAIEEAGPAIFDWMERIADILEMFQNFYEWRNPRYTGVTLSFLFAGFVLITLTPTWLLVKMSFASAGIWFFVLTPLSVKYPRYRLLASPFTWLFWKSPTHAEWAISRLQAEARHNIASPDKQPNFDVKEGTLLGTFTCKSNNMLGRLNVHASRVSFSPRESKLQRIRKSISRDTNDNIETGIENGDGRTGSWSLSFDDLKQMRKTTGKNTLGGEEEGLEFRPLEGENMSVMPLTKRDEVFSQIIGYSGVLWKRCG